MKPEHAQIAGELLGGNFHAGGATILDLGRAPVKLPELQIDAQHIMDEHPYSSVAQAGHVTNWTNPTGDVRQWSLKNTHGDTSNTGEDFDYRLTGKRIIAGVPAIQHFASQIPDLVNMRLNYLGPSSSLAPHEEHIALGIGDPDRFALRARFHVPIFTNSNAMLYADGAWRRATAGRLYFFNNGCVHAARNEGTEPRVHLVFDVKLTERAFDWLEELWMHKRAVRVAKREEITEWVPSGGLSLETVEARSLAYWS